MNIKTNNKDQRNRHQGKFERITKAVKFVKHHNLCPRCWSWYLQKLSANIKSALLIQDYWTRCKQTDPELCWYKQFERIPPVRISKVSQYWDGARQSYKWHFASCWQSSPCHPCPVRSFCCVRYARSHNSPSTFSGTIWYYRQCPSLDDIIFPWTSTVCGYQRHSIWLEAGSLGCPSGICLRTHGFFILLCTCWGYNHVAWLRVHDLRGRHSDLLLLQWSWKGHRCVAYREVCFRY